MADDQSGRDILARGEKKPRKSVGSLTMAPGAGKRSAAELSAAIGRRLGMNEGSKGVSARRVRFQQGVDKATSALNKPPMPAPFRKPPQTQPQEDEPGWQWNRQGNRTRVVQGRYGPQTERADKKGRRYPNAIV